jgi:hypothetical protein
MVAVNFSVFIGIGVKDADVGGDSPKVGLVNFGLVYVLLDFCEEGRLSESSDRRFPMVGFRPMRK